MYRYKDLNGSQAIRLLLLEPGEYGTQLYGSMHHISLVKDQHPQYEAISYAWGSPEKTRSMNISLEEGEGIRGELGLTESLYQGFQALRSSEMARLVWADAVCIDQSNIKERGQQVSMMRDIYSDARAVKVWLGPETDQDANAVALIEKLYDHITAFEQDPKIGIATRAPITLGGDYETDPWTYWYALRQFLDRTWFSRTWIIQEVILGRQVCLLFGRRELPWSTLKKIVENSDKHDIADTLFRSAGGYLGESFRCVESIGKLERLRAAANGMRLLDWLTLTRRFQATDPRDKAFAFLGLSEDVEALGIAADYTEQEDASVKLYKQITLAYLQHSILTGRSLDILSSAGTPANSPRYLNEPTTRWKALPSWVVDWSRDSEQNVFMPDLAGSIPFQASPSSSVLENPLEAATNGSGQQDIVLKVKKLDRIQRFSSRSQPDWHNHRSSKQLSAFRSFHGYLQVAAILKDKLYPTTGEFVENILWQVLVCGLTVDGHPASASCREAYHSYRKCEEVFRCGGTLQDYEQYKSNGAEFERALGRWSVGRKFCSTSNGYLGWVPASARVGDLICIIFGARVPFVIRASDDDRYYQLIGECYIHGIMNGEAMDMQEFPVEDIIFR